MPWLLVAVDDFFKVAPEVFIQCDGRVATLRLAEDFRDGPSAAMRRTDHGNGPMVFPLDNHFASLFDLRQHRAHVARKLGFCDPDGRHLFDHTSPNGSCVGDGPLPGASGPWFHHTGRVTASPDQTERGERLAAVVQRHDGTRKAPVPCVGRPGRRRSVASSSLAERRRYPLCSYSSSSSLWAASVSNNPASVGPSMSLHHSLCR